MDFGALRIDIERVDSLRYNLRCFGVTFDGPTEVYFDKNPVVKNAIIPTSVLKYRHNTIYYHRVRETQASGVFHVG